MTKHQSELQKLLFVLLSYLTVELRHFLGMSRLQSLREERVQTRVPALLTRFLVPHLKNKKTSFKSFSFGCKQFLEPWRRSHLALQLSDSLSKLSLGGLRELRVETLREAPPAALLVFTLREDEPTRPLLTDTL